VISVGGVHGSIADGIDIDKATWTLVPSPTTAHGVGTA
jgi:hypothetical protein